MKKVSGKQLTTPLFVLYALLTTLQHTAADENVVSMLSYIVTEVQTEETYEAIRTQTGLTSFRCNILCILSKHGCNRVKKTNKDGNGLIDCQLLKVLQTTSQQISSQSSVENIRDRHVNFENPVDGGWSEWQNVGNCSKVCGTGTQQKSRSCTNPEPSGVGLDCAGASNNQVDCNTFTCTSANLHLMKDKGYLQLTDIGDETALIDVEGNEAWIVIQNHVVGNLDFNRSWAEYKDGFGIISPDEDFWLGNNAINALCELHYSLELRIQMISQTRNDVVDYGKFIMEDEPKNFRLELDDYSGSLEDTFSLTHMDQYFSTFDKDNDGTNDKSCANDHGSGWWFDNCYDVSLNSRLEWKSNGQTLQYQQSIMKVRVKTNVD